MFALHRVHPSCCRHSPVPNRLVFDTTRDGGVAMMADYSSGYEGGRRCRRCRVSARSITVLRLYVAPNLFVDISAPARWSPACFRWSNHTTVVMEFMFAPRSLPTLPDPTPIIGSMNWSPTRTTPCASVHLGVSSRVHARSAHPQGRLVIALTQKLPGLRTL